MKFAIEAYHYISAYSFMLAGLGVFALAVLSVGLVSVPGDWGMTLLLILVAMIFIALGFVYHRILTKRSLVLSRDALIIPSWRLEEKGGVTLQSGSRYTTIPNDIEKLIIASPSYFEGMAKNTNNSGLLAVVAQLKSWAVRPFLVVNLFTFFYRYNVWTINLDRMIYVKNKNGGESLLIINDYSEHVLRRFVEDLNNLGVDTDLIDSREHSDYLTQESRFRKILWLLNHKYKKASIIASYWIIIIEILLVVGTYIFVVLPHIDY